MGALNDADGSLVRNRPNQSPVPPASRQGGARPATLTGAYAFLLLFMVIYVARPEDWIPGLSAVPLAKIAAALALVALTFSVLRSRLRLPREVFYFLLLVGQMFLAAALSSVWKGGAIQTSLEFSKIFILVVIMALVVNTSSRLRQLVFVQATSVALIAAVTIWKGRFLLGRLEGMLGGNYDDPNDLALAIIISLPLCLALLFLTRSLLLKAGWTLAMSVMLYAVFLTGSRGGFVSLIATVAAVLWEFAVQGRRRYLFVLAALGGALLWNGSAGLLSGRLKGTFNSSEDTAASYGSAEAREQLFWRSLEVTKNHPLFGVGPGNFEEVSGTWHVTHNSFTQMSAEAGLPALVLYVLILWCGFQNVKAVKRRASGQRDAIIVAKSLNASLVGYVVGSFFLSVSYDFFPYFLIAYTSAQALIAERSGAELGRKGISVRDSCARRASTHLPEAIRLEPILPQRS